MSQQLLCSFTTLDGLYTTLKQIITSYNIAFDTIYILENIDVPGALCVTYNINSAKGPYIPSATIALHRKKSVNALYSINALNLLVAELNDGKLDNSFELPWNDYKNTILVSAYGKLKRINTRLDRIIKVSEIEL